MLIEPKLFRIARGTLRVSYVLKDVESSLKYNIKTSANDLTVLIEFS